MREEFVNREEKDKIKTNRNFAKVVANVVND